LLPEDYLFLGDRGPAHQITDPAFTATFTGLPILDLARRRQAAIPKNSPGSVAGHVTRKRP
jgi:hypothetical protein